MQPSQAKELDANTEYYIELLAKGIGKPKEEIAKDIQRPKYFQAQEAIEYGIADKIIDSRDAAFEKRVLLTLLNIVLILWKWSGNLSFAWILSCFVL